MSSNDLAARPDELHPGWRAFLVAMAILLFTGGITLHYLPSARYSSEVVVHEPQVASKESTPSPSQSGWTTEKLTTAQGESTTVVLAMLASSLVMAVVAANGLRLSKISKDGADFHKPTNKQVKDAIEGSQLKNAIVEDDAPPEPAAAPVKLVRIGEVRARVFEPSSIPIKVLRDLEAADETAIESIDDVDFAVRPDGQGNHSWVIRAKNGNSYRVSYGGRSKESPTITQESAS